MRLQYEPLSVRSGDPSVNGRWLATLRNLFDVDTILRKGFYMNGDHMIVKRWDDIVEREYRNYMYLKDVTYEREKWNLPANKHSKKFHKSRKQEQKDTLLNVVQVNCAIPVVKANRISFQLVSMILIHESLYYMKYCFISVLVFVIL